MVLVGKCRGWVQETELIAAFHEHPELFPNFWNAAASTARAGTTPRCTDRGHGLTGVRRHTLHSPIDGQIQVGDEVAAQIDLHDLRILGWP